MGFFSKKASVPDRNDPSEIANAKIRVMQNDLDEIARNGYVEIESDPQEKPKPKESPNASNISANKDTLPTGSPFSQPIYPLSENTLSDMPAIPVPTSSEIQKSQNPAPRNVPASVIRKSVPLNLPILETAESIRKPSLPNETPKSAPEVPLPKPSETRKLPDPPETQQKSLRVEIRSTEQSEKGASSLKTFSPKNFPEKPPLHETTADKAALSDNIILKEQRGWKQFLFVFVAVAMLGGGAFYFWKTRGSVNPTDSSAPSHPNIPDISTDQEANPILKPEKPLPFSMTNPNPFLVDVETETVSTLREQLIKNAETMRQANMTGPVPFSVVDKNNTPIAFFIFASVFNLGLSGDLLNSLDNAFTMYLFIDNGKPRIVLAISEKNSEDTKEYLSESEKTLPLNLKNIFLEETPSVSSIASFAHSDYRNIPIRYFNFSADVSLSLDYAIIGNTLLIGTSKNAERAGIDTLLDTKK